MSPTQPPPAPPSDAIEATEYKIQDKVYFLYNKIWRKGEVKNYEGSSSESPRYLIEDEATKQEHKMASSQMRKREDGQLSSNQT